ncbi:MAG: hypothetical protein ACSLE1_19625 [Sphingobium sp.]
MRGSPYPSQSHYIAGVKVCHVDQISQLTPAGAQLDWPLAEWRVAIGQRFHQALFRHVLAELAAAWPCL